MVDWVHDEGVEQGGAEMQRSMDHVVEETKKKELEEFVSGCNG